MDILIIYQFCSFGGVERVVLNRTKTFRKYSQDVRVTIGYLQDLGALSSFQAYIKANDLGGAISAFLINPNSLPALDRYDFVFNIDTPQIFEATRYAGNMVMECHTPYVENRQYLKNLPPNIHSVIVPSHAFKSLVLGEFPKLPPVFVLPNPVSEEFFSIPVSKEKKFYTKKPLAYLARLDKLKNFTEATRIFELFKKDENVMFAVAGRGAEDTNLLSEYEAKELLGKTFLRDRIDFDDVPAYIRMIKNHGGIFISPSTGESFGLSAAEFISAGVPVLLSDIPPHRELVNEDERFIYQLGDIASANNKIDGIFERWEDDSKTVEGYGRKFDGTSFIQAWQDFLNAQK
ncbi:MAG: glycosyltransferase family 4 protein [Chloroflexi bacterium]|nr:glycosyltransferase family 4 protein [Chloroflexota bacterium]